MEQQRRRSAVFQPIRSIHLIHGQVVVRGLGMVLFKRPGIRTQAGKRELAVLFTEPLARFVVRSLILSILENQFCDCRRFIS